MAQRDADRERRLMIVGDGSQRPADPRPLEEYRQHGDQQAGCDGGPEVELVDQDAAGDQTLEQDQGILRDAEVESVDLAAEQRLAENHRGRR